MNYYQRHIGDYLRDASHLSLLEHGVYTRLMDVYYSREEPIPDDQKYRLVGARSDEERAAVDAVLSEFFALRDGAWVQSRCESELEIAAAKSEKARQSAQSRWSAGEPTQTERKPKAKPTESESKAVEMPTDSERNANAMRTQCEGNAPNNHHPITNLHPTPPKGSPLPSDLSAGDSSPEIKNPADWWSEFCEVYPKRSGSLNRADAQKKFLARVKSGIDPAEIVDGARRYRAWAEATGKVRTELVTQMTTWLNQERWTEEYEIPDDLPSRDKGRPVSTSESRRRLLGVA